MRFPEGAGLERRGRVASQESRTYNAKWHKGARAGHMGTRPPADEIIKGLTTTADKIRALAKASYDRTEISQALGIRYQHVRKVLLRSGSRAACAGRSTLNVSR